MIYCRVSLLKFSLDKSLEELDADASNKDAKFTCCKGAMMKQAVSHLTASMRRVSSMLPKATPHIYSRLRKASHSRKFWRHVFVWFIPFILLCLIFPLTFAVPAVLEHVAETVCEILGEAFIEAE